MQGLTDRQQQVLSYIRESIHDRGYPPTLREIGAHMGIRSTNGVNDHLRALERKGYLTREDMKSRALRPKDLEMPAGLGPANDHTDAEIASIPLLGRIAAGAPILADERADEQIHIGKSMLRTDRDVFALRVQGDSMIEAGVLSGDTIFVHRQDTARRGEMVAALIGDEATVKYYFPEKDYVRFQPANAAMAPILVRASDFRSTMILGTVVGVFRRM